MTKNEIAVLINSLLQQVAFKIKGEIETEKFECIMDALVEEFLKLFKNVK